MVSSLLTPTLTENEEKPGDYINFTFLFREAAPLPAFYGFFFED